MADTGTLDRIVALAAKQFGVDASKVNVDAPVGQLGVDSLGFLEFLFELEEAFDVLIDTDAARAVGTIRDLARLIDQLIETSGKRS